jgi:hypothetical protein
VRCGETAVFSIRDGGSCAVGPPGVWPMKDGSNTHTLTCAPASGDDPCSGCAGSADLNGCRWTWKAPKDDKAAAALVTPSNQQCTRCTDYKPASVKEWLCSALTGCPGTPGDLAAATCPAQEYPGTRRCWLRDNWANVLKLQGLGPSVDGIVLGGGDRSVTLNLAALECACTAWGLNGKVVALKDAPCVAGGGGRRPAAGGRRAGGPASWRAGRGTRRLDQPPPATLPLRSASRPSPAGSSQRTSPALRRTTPMTRPRTARCRPGRTACRVRRAGAWRSGAWRGPG